MNKIFFLLPFVLSLAVTLGVLFYTWRYRSVRGARAYLWYVGGQCLWILGYTLELVNLQLNQKIFWDQIQWVAGLFITVSFPVFAVRYTETRLRRPLLLFVLSLIVPISFLAVIVTDGQHHLLYPNPHLDHSQIFSELRYDFTWVVYGYALYAYLITFSSLGLLVKHIFKPHRLYTRQIVVVVIGFLIPIAFTILTTMGVDFMPYRDISPFTFAVGNILIAWGLFRFHLFKVVPIAREIVVDSMEDQVVVLDIQDRVVDINPSALAIIDMKAAQVIGQPAEVVFSNWPDLLETFQTPENFKTTLKLDFGDRQYHFETRSTLIQDKRGQYTGRVFVARDISEHIELERELQRFNEELGARVAERTQQLAEAYDTTLEGWATALEMRDKETKAHSQRVIRLTIKLASKMGYQGEDLAQVRRGAILHDIGKMAIPDEILLKRSDLTPEEREIVEQHPIHSYELLSRIPYLKDALDIPYCHHEHWDGKGYPRGLTGDQIPLPARIFAVVDVWDAVQSDRPYNSPWPRERAIQYLKEQSGSQFDPEVVGIFLEMVASDEI